MGRFLFFLVLALVAYFAIRALRRRQQPRTPPKKVAESMVHCDLCGLYLPESEAVHAQGRHYCSVEHQRGAQK